MKRLVGFFKTYSSAFWQSDIDTPIKVALQMEKEIVRVHLVKTIIVF